MNIIIIGGSHAGLSIANFLHTLNPEIEITLFEKSDTLGFIPSSINLMLQGYYDSSEMERGETAKAENLIDSGIHLFTNTEVSAIDKRAKEVTYHIVGDNVSATLSYDYLILAMGSEKFETTFPLPSNDSVKLTTYKYRKDTELAYPKLRDSHEVVVIGAGLIGLELAVSLCADKTRHVTILERMEAPMFRYFDAEIIEMLMPRLPDNLTLLTNQYYYDIKQDDNTEKLIITTEDNAIITADACVLALNPKPNSTLAGTVVDLDFDGTVKVDAHLQTSDPYIYALGDLIKVPFMNAEERIYLPLILNAKRESYVIAFNMLYDKKLVYPTSQRAIGTELFGVYMGSTGITESEAPFYDKKVKTVVNTYDTLSNYGDLQHCFMRLKLIYEEDTQQILGVQIATTARQILELTNLFSSLITHQDTILDLLHVDYYFAPKLSPLINIFGDIVAKVFKENK